MKAIESMSIFRILHQEQLHLRAIHCGVERFGSRFDQVVRHHRFDCHLSSSRSGRTHRLDFGSETTSVAIADVE